ncbi:MAG: TylF/MycF/NovP-related O-methyltransferase [Chlamydiales bacterium]
MTLSLSLLTKVKNKLGSAYPRIEETQFTLFLAKELANVLCALKNKPQLSTAIADFSLLGIAEALGDCGFVFHDPAHAYFGGDPKDGLHPFNPLSDLEKYPFDVIFSKDQTLMVKGVTVINLPHFVSCVRRAYKSIKNRNLNTCLHVQKLAILAAVTYLSPFEGDMIEVGSYQCGTTIFLARLMEILKKPSRIYALDMFGGMPASTEPDRVDAIFYDEGMFLDNQLPLVRKRIRQERVEKRIHLIQGDVEKTLPQLYAKNIQAPLMFLDTDQYKGTKAGLNAVSPFCTKVIVVDDTELFGVNLAIQEFLEKEPSFCRKNLSINFDLLFTAPMSIDS